MVNRFAEKANKQNNNNDNNENSSNINNDDDDGTSRAIKTPLEATRLTSDNYK